MRVKLYIPGINETLFEYPLEMPCRFNLDDLINLEDVIDLEKLDNDEKKAIAKETFKVKTSAFQKDQEGIFQFVLLSRGTEAK